MDKEVEKSRASVMRMFAKIEAREAKLRTLKAINFHSSSGGGGGGHGHHPHHHHNPEGMLLDEGFDEGDGEFGDEDYAGGGSTAPTNMNSAAALVAAEAIAAIGPEIAGAAAFRLGAPPSSSSLSSTPSSSSVAAAPS